MTTRKTTPNRSVWRIWAMVDSDPQLNDLRSAVQLACQPQNASRIVAGREQVLSLPRAWVVEHIEQVAAEALDLTDYWEYRRLLELADLLSRELLQRLVVIGLESHDPEIQEAAGDFAIQA